MKRLGIAVLTLFVLAALPAAGAPAHDSDTLLTSDGTLYTIESRFGLVGAASLVLTTQRDNVTSSMAVPAASGEGSHTRPALAYDSESKTLFVFWQKASSPVATELLFTSYQNGKWSQATSIDRGAWRLRFNLRVGVTGKMEEVGEDGTSAIVPGLTVHATWWEETGSAEVARYAMLAIDKGSVASIAVHDLTDFVKAPAGGGKAGEAPADNDVLRQPILIESGQETIDVVFGVTRTNKLHRVTLKPTFDGRIRIPITVKETPMSAPRHRLAAAGDSRISAVGVSAAEGLVFYTSSNRELRYIAFQNGEWTPVRSIALSETFSSDAAVNALRRMAASQ